MTSEVLVQKILAMNGISDHINIFIGMKPDCCLSDLVREIKKSSNHFINEKQFTPFKFAWQDLIVTSTSIYVGANVYFWMI